VTDRKRTADEILQARHDAERANLAKTEFLSRMSHELRTPLNAILGFSQLLDDDGLDAEQRQSVGYITQAGRHLLGLINEVLDISRIESGQLSISPEPVSVEELVDEVLALIRPLATGREIHVDAQGADVVGSVVADRQRLKQVLLNLLSNAVKYNREAGSISIRCASADGDRVRISVVDTGYGIAPAHLERLFRPFDRIGAENGGVEGTGIGLALTRGLIDAMGGEIGVESALEIGSTFWFELPRAEATTRHVDLEPASVALAHHDGPRRTILQIEDNLSNLRLVERIIARQPGIELVSAEHGRRGLELARDLQPDLILLDLHLPDLSGREVLRSLRTNRSTRHIPVVIVSADATDRQITVLKDAGAFGYLTKPLDVGEFLRTIDRAMGAAGQPPPASEGSAPAAGRPRPRRSSQRGVSSPTA
jgi:CheY-like chemotaxis protein